MEALSISFPPLNSVNKSLRETKTHTESSLISETKGFQSINVYFDKELYDVIYRICDSQIISLSRFIANALKDYLSRIIDGCDELKFRTKEQLQAKKVKGVRKTGLGVDRDLYYEIREYANKHDTSMSEVVRTVTNDYVLRNYPEYSIKDDSSDAEYVKETAEHAKESDAVDEFVMYIDLG